MQDDNSTAPSADRIALLQTFVRIVEAGSLSAAAAQLQSTQPTISRRLQALERALGVRLLQRSTHVMRLTLDGERCLAGARDLLADWSAFEAGLRGVAHEAEGHLRIVVPHAFGQERLVQPLASTAPSRWARCWTRRWWLSSWPRCRASLSPRPRC